jgi:hypothetical protein
MKEEGGEGGSEERKEGDGDIERKEVGGREMQFI